MPAPAALVLSAQPADARSNLLALVVVIVSALVFLAIAPFATTPLAAHPIFIPVNQTLLIANDLITALLLLAQLRVTGSRALLVLACGYVFTALMATVHLLTFPGVFAPTGLLGAGPQTTGYLFVFWHSGFPLAVIVYAQLKRRQPRVPVALARAVAASLAATVLLVAGLTLLATLGNDWFPPMLDGNRYSSQFNIGRYGQWVLTATSIAVAWRSKPRSVLDLWLLVALFSSFIEIGLVGIFNGGRYDLGFYAGRLYGLLASVFVLAVLLFEQARLYSGVVGARAMARAEADARASRDVLRLAMAAGGMGAWSIELATGKVWASSELEGILGLQPGTFRGTARPILKRIHREDVARVRRAVEQSIAQHQEFVLEFRFCHGQGAWRWMDLRGRLAVDDEGVATELVGVGTDITERKRAEAALRENDRRKDEFLATLAHELRNPLAPIRNSVEVMSRMSSLPAAVERMRGVIDRQSQQLSRLVDDLLDVSRITQGKVRLVKGRVSIAQALRDALEATRPAADAAAQEVIVAIEGDELYCEADATRLMQVFVNLLTNATKFTPDGGRIVVTAHRDEEAARISIRDTGIGVDPAHVESIFGIFAQAHSPLERGHGGLGIGLALVRGFVELHGGTVQVRSDGAGHGSEFIVRLPLDRPAPTPAPVQEINRWRLPAAGA